MMRTSYGFLDQSILLGWFAGLYSWLGHGAPEPLDSLPCICTCVHAETYCHCHLHIITLIACMHATLYVVI